MNPKKEGALEALHNRHSVPEKFLANLPAFLKSEREHYQLTQKELADWMNLATQSYQAYESGKSIPTLPNFIRLADFFDVSLDEMIGRNSD